MCKSFRYNQLFLFIEKHTGHVLSFFFFLKTKKLTSCTLVLEPAVVMCIKSNHFTVSEFVPARGQVIIMILKEKLHVQKMVTFHVYSSFLKRISWFSFFFLVTNYLNTLLVICIWLHLCNIMGST